MSLAEIGEALAATLRRAFDAVVHYQIPFDRIWDLLVTIGIIGFVGYIGFIALYGYIVRPLWSAYSRAKERKQARDGSGRQ